MSNTGPFDISNEEHLTMLLVDGTWLDSSEPIWLSVDGQPVRGEEVIVRVKLTPQESEKLWRLLDSTVGANAREGEQIKEDFERAIAAGADTRIPTKAEYDAAIRVCIDRRIPQQDQRFLEAAEIINSYERAHGER